MVEENYTEEELQQARQQAAMGFGYPQSPEKESIFKFFKFMIERGDSSKIGNLNKQELGNPRTSVRGFQSTALYVKEEGWDLVSNFLRAEGEIVLSTSASLKGFYPTLFVTQIKHEKKIKTGEEKKGWLSRREKPEQQHSEAI